MMIIMIVTLKGVIRGSLVSSLCHELSPYRIAQVTWMQLFANHLQTHWMPLTCQVVQIGSSTVKFDRVEIAFNCLMLLAETIH